MRARFDLRDWIDGVAGAVARHALGPPGAYRRWTRPPPSGETGPWDARNPYACADAANLLYTVGRFPRRDRDAWVTTLRALQDPESGLFREATHDPLHTTAHCLGALELFDAGPRHPLRALAPLRDPLRMESFLDGLAWRENPWIESHKGAGLYAALLLAGEVSPAWEDAYFEWLRSECDPETGLWRRGRIPPLDPHGIWVFPHLAGTFHYLFNHEHARRPHPHPAALVDTCLTVFERELFPFATMVGFAELDWVYCLTRSLAQCGHRFAEARVALERFAERFVPWLTGLDLEKDPGLDDAHALFGALCALAELQRVLPGWIRTEPSLRLVLDRRPFV